MAKSMPMRMTNHRMPMRPAGGAQTKMIPMHKVMEPGSKPGMQKHYMNLSSKQKKSEQDAD